MTSWSSREELVHQTVTLYRQRLSRRAIARALGISRNTVRKILTQHARRREQGHAALEPKPTHTPRPTKLDAYHGQIAELLSRYPEITAQRVFEELRGAGCAGSYTQVKVYVRRVRPRPKVKPSLPTPTYGPGKMAESDWSPYTIDFTVAGRQLVQAFAYVLCTSRRKSFGLYEHGDFYALCDGHVQTFERFEGVAEVCKYDGQKAVVLGWEGRQPLYNPRFLAFSSYYEFRPQACRPDHPNDKPHVERAFWEFERSFLNGRSFRDLEDMRQQLAWWERNTCDLRPHKKLKRTPLAMFADEAPHLIPLPCHPYDTARVVYRVCSIDGFVCWDGNRYAVPYDHITDILPVRVTQHELYVYAADLTCVARHELAPRSAGLDLVPPGVHPPPWKKRGADRDQLRLAFEKMGPPAADYFASMSVAIPRLVGYHARQILVLRERYATTDLCAAMSHARTFGAFDHNAVARILAARCAPRTLAEYVTEDAARRLEDHLGACETCPRDLEEYDRLPVLSPSPKEHPCPDVDHPSCRPTPPSSDSEVSSSSSD